MWLLGSMLNLQISGLGLHVGQCWGYDPISMKCVLGCPHSQDASGKWRFRLGSPTKNIIILVVTVTGQGDNPKYVEIHGWISIHSGEKKTHQWAALFFMGFWKPLVSLNKAGYENPYFVRAFSYQNTCILTGILQLLVTSQPLRR